jgi:hypothetical protein
MCCYHHVKRRRQHGLPLTSRSSGFLPPSSALAHTTITLSSPAYSAAKPQQSATADISCMASQEAGTAQLVATYAATTSLTRCFLCPGSPRSWWPGARVSTYSTSCHNAIWLSFPARNFTFIRAQEPSRTQHVCSCLQEVAALAQ